MSDRTIGGTLYQVGRLDARTQFHVARRLTPVMSAMVGHLRADAAGAELLEALGPMSNALAEMRDEDADFVITKCLTVCQRANPHGTGYSPAVAPNGRIMFEDIDMPAMLQLVWAVIQENLSGFFSALPSGSPGGTTDSPA